MKYIYYLVLFIFTNSVDSKIDQNDTHLQNFTKAKKIIEKHCFKCHKGQANMMLEAVELLENLNEAELGSLNKLDVMKLLADAYGNMYNYSNSKELYVDKQQEVYKKMINMDPCGHSYLLLKIRHDDKSKMLETLNPILKMQGPLFQAKLIESQMYFDNGKNEEGLKALDVASSLATFKEAEYSAFRIAELYKKHGRVDSALKILKLKYGSQVSSDDLKKILDKQ